MGNSRYLSLAMPTSKNFPQCLESTASCNMRITVFQGTSQYAKKLAAVSIL